MSLKMYFDAAGTQQILTAEKLTGAGPFNLLAFNGAQLGGVYKETKVAHAGISFNAGVGTGFTGLTPDVLKGQRVLHGSQYIGQVTANTATTVTVSDLAYSGGSAACYISSYVKLYSPTDFTLSGDTITMVVPPAGNEVIHAVPVDTLAMFFGGTAGSSVTKTSEVYIKRDSNFDYTSLQVSSEDTSVFPYHSSTTDVVFTGGVGVGFAGLPVGGLVGKAVNHAGTFIGIVTANTESSVTVGTAYSGVSATAEIYNIGALEFSLNGVTYAPVIYPSDMTAATSDTTLIYVRDTLNIPEVAINYPANIIKVSGIEYIA